MEFKTVEAAACQRFLYFNRQEDETSLVVHI
jgi:hypothetical protein